MAYLDKDGIPKVSESVKLHNERIDEVINQLSCVQNHLEHTLRNISGEHRIADDPKIFRNLEYCMNLLEECKKCCISYYEC